MIKLMVGILATASLLGATQATLTDSEREKVLKALSSSETEFLDSLKNVSEAQWNFKAAPEKWSIAETAEHIMLSEPLLFSMVSVAMQNPVEPEWEAKTGAKVALLERALPDRSKKAQAPEQLQPKSGLTREQVIARFKTERSKTIEFAKSTDLSLKEHVSPHPFFGPLNAYEWLLSLPLHNHRHNLQIAEVKTAPGYPAN